MSEVVDQVLRRLEEDGNLEGCRDFAEFSHGLEKVYKDAMAVVSFEACAGCKHGGGSVEAPCTLKNQEGGWKFHRDDYGFLILSCGDFVEKTL